MKKLYTISIIVLGLIICILAAIITGLIVSLSGNTHSKYTGQTEAENAGITISATSVEEKISPSANIYMQQSYKECGHTTTEKYGVPEEIVNMTKAEVEKYYYGWDIKNFSDKELTIYKENPGLCEEHFIIKDVNGVVTVFNYDEGKKEKLYLTTQVLTKYLPKDDYEKIKKGINIVGKNNLYELLQDYE